MYERELHLFETSVINGSFPIKSRVGSTVYLDDPREAKDVDFVLILNEEIDDLEVKKFYTYIKVDGYRVFRRFNPPIDCCVLDKQTFEEFLQNPFSVSIKTRNMLNSMLMIGRFYEGREIVLKKIKEKYKSFEKFNKQVSKCFILDHEMTNFDKTYEMPERMRKNMLVFSYYLKTFSLFYPYSYKIDRIRRELKNRNIKINRLVELQRELLELSTIGLKVDGIYYNQS